jgi:hypothetical protein
VYRFNLLAITLQNDFEENEFQRNGLEEVAYLERSNGEKDFRGLLV